MKGIKDKIRKVCSSEWLVLFLIQTTKFVCLVLEEDPWKSSGKYFEQQVETDEHFQSLEGWTVPSKPSNQKLMQLLSIKCRAERLI